MSNAKANPPPPSAPAEVPSGAPVSRMSLANIQSGRVRKPPRTLLYGVEGVGKTTWAAGAPSPILLPVEDGSHHIDVARLPRPVSFDDILLAQRLLREGEHEYKTLVVDTLDAIEPLIWQAVIAQANAGGRGPVRTIEEVGGGYGKGYVAALDLWRRWLRSLELLETRRDMQIVVLAHAHVKTQKNPGGDDYDRHMIKVNDKAAAAVREWADDVLFACFEVQTRKGKGFGKAKAVGGQRIVYTSTSPVFEAKNRSGLPASMPLDFGDYLEAIEANAPADPAVLTTAIETLLSKLPDEAIKSWVAGELARKPSPDRLAKIRDRLAAKVEELARREQEMREAAGADPEVDGGPAAPQEREPGSDDGD